VRTKNGIVAELRGGFGNQLFILMAAWTQAERLNCPLYLDISALKGGNIRSYALGRLEHPGILISRPRPVAFLMRVAPRFGIRRRLFREASFAFDPNINSVRIGTSLEGYFQSPEYFIGMEDRLLDLLLGVHLDDEEKAFVQSFSEGETIHAHVRRGDYLLAHNRSQHGLASLSYFVRARQLLGLLGNPKDCTIFTDSPAFVREEFKGCAGFNIVGEEGDRFDDIVQILAMSQTSSFIMSNSSFSWWAAWIVSRRSAQKFNCVAPRPWFVDGNSASDLLLENWITLSAKTERL
jgi:hypothetical protein